MRVLRVHMQVCADLCMSTHDVCAHVCHVCRDKRLERELHEFQLWFPTVDAGISDDAVVSIAFSGFYQDAY